MTVLKEGYTVIFAINFTTLSNNEALAFVCITRELANDHARIAK